ncbi:MAG: magnesium transporter CorA family protein [Pleurocapsa minor GSE-CHR-MK-17-07R]|jgi:magnesium transporter|nr:magnesium transporter CorA family protein [Pleurocapsa minor GSE-CHR-MK 17-07R]
MGLTKLTYGSFTWYDINDPTIHDIAGLRRALPRLSELNLEDALSNIERPKFDYEDDYMFVVLLFPLFDRKTRMTRGTEVDFFVGKDFVVTVHDGVLKPLLTTMNTCSEDMETRMKLLGGTSAHFFYVLLDRLVDYMFPLLYKIESNIRQIEENIFEEQRDVNLIQQIALARRDAIAVRRIIHQQLPILTQIEHRISTYVEGELEDYFGDLVDHAQKARDVIDEDFEVITALSNTADSLLTHRLNAVIRVLTVISVIMLPLSLVSGIFGMNVDLPLAERTEAFVIICAIMLAIIVGMLAFFRVRKWI